MRAGRRIALLQALLVLSLAVGGPAAIAQTKGQTKGQPQPKAAATQPPPAGPAPIEVVPTVGHEVSRIIYARDGRWIATASSDQVKVWDAASGRLLRSFPAPDNGVSGLAFAPDGRSIAIGNSPRRTGSSGNPITTYELATGAVIRAYAAENTPWACSIAFTGNGQNMVSAGCGRDSSIAVWSVANAGVREIKGFGRAVIQLWLSPDSRHVYARGANRPGSTYVVRVFEVATGREPRTFPESQMQSTAAALAPNGAWFAVAGESETRIIDTATGQRRRVLTVGAAELAVSPDSTRLAVSDGNEMLAIFDVATGNRLLDLKLKADAVVFAPDGRALAVSNNGTLELRDAQTGEVMRTLGRYNPVSALAADPGGKLLAVGTSSGHLHQWDMESGTLRRTTPAHAARIQSLSVPAGGSFIASGGDDDVASIWQVSDGARLARFEKVSGNLFYVQGLWLSTDGQRLIARKHLDFGDKDREKAAFPGEPEQSDNWLLMRSLAAPGTVEARRHIEAFALSGDGTRQAVVSGADESVARLIDFDGAAVRHTTPMPGLRANSVALDPAGDRIAVAARNGVEVWDLANGRRIRQLHVHSQLDYRSSGNVAYSPDGRWLATARSGGGIDIWNARTLERLRTIADVKSELSPIVFSPDSRRIAFGREVADPRQWDVALWDVESGVQARGVGGFQAPVLGLAFAPDGQRLAVVQYLAMSVHDLASGQTVRRFAAPADASISAACFTPDGASLAFNLRSVVVIRRIADGRETARHAGPEPDSEQAPAVESIRVTPDARTLAITYGDGAAQRIEIATRQARHIAGVPGGTMLTATSPDARSLLRVWVGKSVMIEEAGTRPRIIRAIEDFNGGASHVAMSRDGRHVAAGGPTYRGAKAGLWETDTGRLVRAIDVRPRQVAVGANGTWLAVVDDKGRIVAATAGGGEPRQITTNRTFEVTIAAGADPRHLVVGGTDGTVRVYDVEKGELLATMIAGTDGEWVILTPEGFFGVSSPKAAGLLSIVRGTEVLGIEQLYQSLYRPDLVQQKLAGDPRGLVREAARRLDLQRILDSGHVPRVAFVSHRSGDQAQSDLVTVEASVADQGGGVGRIEWRLNGTTIGIVEGGPAGLDRGALPRDRPAGGLRQEIYLDPGDNLIEVVAYNRLNLVASVPASVKLVRAGGQPSSRPRLYILALGVNDYFDSRFTLRYAVSDARKLIEGLKESGRGLYDGEPEVVGLFDSDVTVEKVDAAFAALATRVRENDVFIFFGAGHGVTHDGRYFFLPRDFRFQTVESYGRSAIGQDRWQAWFAAIRARKALLIFDTCESGTLTEDPAAAGVRGGLQQAAAIGRLIQATGRLWLTAAAGDRPAREGYNGHGVFTYALLDALARADRNSNELVEVSELVGHVDALVPEISYRRWGQRQVPQRSVVGADFPLAKQVARLSPAPDHEPVIISTRPTHIAPAGGQVFAEKGGQGGVVRELKPFTVVTLLKEEGDFALIAKEGERLGYIAKASLQSVQ
jgi:WD40 repeat protein